MNRTVPLAVAGVAVVGSMLVAGTSQGAATNYVARWDMNEPLGAKVLADTTGHGLTGTIGSKVGHGVYWGVAATHKFPYKAPNSLPADPQRIDLIPHRSALNPGSKDFTVTVRLRSTHRFGNIIQKGQGGTFGGYFKMEQPDAIYRCLFAGTQGQASLADNRRRNDNVLHIVKCSRDGTLFQMTVDGVVVMSKTRTIGTISNSKPVSIGGKASCDVVNVSCDYFVGEIDYAHWLIGP